jgi:YVTN family beta-propeller protein
MVVAAMAGVLAAGGVMQGQATPARALLVLSKEAHTLSIVDPASLKVLARMPVGDDPHEVIASEDGRTAYVSNYGGGSLHTMAVLDLVGQKALASVDISPLHGAHGLEAMGGKIWFTAEGSKVIGTYDPATQKVDWVMGTGQDRTHMLMVSKDLSHVVTSNVASGTVSFLDKMTKMQGPPGRQEAKTDWEQTVVKVGSNSEGFDISPDGKEVWIANAGEGTVSVIDAATRSVTATLEVDVKSANRLKFTPDGKMVLISLLNSPDLVMVDVAVHKVTKRLPIGRGAAGILIDRVGQRAFVACTPDNYVTVVDLNKMAVMGKLDAGGGPDGMAWAERK